MPWQHYPVNKNRCCHHHRKSRHCRDLSRRPIYTPPLSLWALFLYTVLLVFIASTNEKFGVSANGPTKSSYLAKDEHESRLKKNPYSVAMEHFESKRYEEAAPLFWHAIMNIDKGGGYTVEDAYVKFIDCYRNRGVIADGLAFIAKQYILRSDGFSQEGHMYAEQALQFDPLHKEAKTMFDYMDRLAQNEGGKGIKQNKYNETPEEMYNRGTTFFNNKQYASAAALFEQSCMASDQSIHLACVNAVFCRTNICQWGESGKQFDADMERIALLIEFEKLSLMDETGSWKRQMSAHPHMMLGFPMKDSKLQRYVCESHAATDEQLARIQVDEKTQRPYVRDLEPGLPIDQEQNFPKHLAESKSPDFRIKVGFIAAGMNSKAVLYLSHDMFRFFDKERFQVHIFATQDADSPQFIQQAMRGVDWRERVRSNVDYFHEVMHMNNNHMALAKFIDDLGIHIMIDWDGYARQGERPQGLYALRPAPIQIFHQEFLGTSGSLFVDYLITDQIVSPEYLQNFLYTEKFIYLPNHFFSKGHAVQEEILPPTFDFKKPRNPYVLGTGSPQENRCLAPSPNKNVSFVYCNFHKFLKLNPDTVRSWLDILENVPDSILCLLENPVEGVVHLRKFINEINPTLNSRIHFVPWENSPFDHQRRNRDLCNVVLDTHPYNGHTTTMDALYAGVPVVTRSDGDYMASRVTTSGNIVLGLEEMNAYGLQEYTNVATKIGTNATLFNSIRSRLINTALQKDPMHPFWDVSRYVRNFERGLEMAWEKYILGIPPENILVVETMEEKDTFEKHDDRYLLEGEYDIDAAEQGEDDDKNKKHLDGGSQEEL